MRRVAVTAIGAVCSHGNNVSEIWDTLLSGESRIGPIAPVTHFDPATFTKSIKPETPVAANPLGNAELAALAEVEKPQRYDRHQLFALIAAKEAMDMLGGMRTAPPTRSGCIVGTGDGGLEADHTGVSRLLQNERLDPFTNIRELPNIFAGLLANRFELKGPNYVHCTACAASSHAIMHGADQIRLGRADLMLVGGAEAAITPFGIGSFSAQRALGTDSRPYQKTRDGFVMGEGAAMLVLEDFDTAQKRGAPILAELAGYGSTADGNADAQITDPDPYGGARATLEALLMAEATSPLDLDLVLTHGTATPVGDIAELRGIAHWMESFSERESEAQDMRQRIAICALKSYFGHLLGAAGALASVVAMKMITEKVLLPTRGLSEDTLDPECAGFAHVMGSPRVHAVKNVIVNAFGFGGTNASLYFKGV